MKTKLLTSAIIAIIVPTTVFASVGTEKAFRSIRQPFNEEKQADTKPFNVKEVRNVLGQSDAVTRAFYRVSAGTKKITSFPESDHKDSDIGNPLDW